MELNKKPKLIILIAAIFVIVAILFMFGGNIASFSWPFSSSIRSDDTNEMPVATSGTERIGKGVKVEQTFINSTDVINQIGIVFYKIEQVENVNVVVELLDGSKVLASNVYLAENVESEHRTFLIPNEPLSGMNNKKLKLKIYSLDGLDTGLGILINEEMESSYKFNGSNRKGTLCFAVE